MKRKQKRTQIFLAVSFIFFLSVFSAYLYYNNYVETDFPSAKPTFDNPGQNSLFTNQETKSFAFGQNTSSFILETYLLRQLSPLSFGMSSLEQKLFPLRC
jgi:heme/copper-type cytochrome/quinol oxidase subunit 3